MIEGGEIMDDMILKRTYIRGFDWRPQPARGGGSQERGFLYPFGIEINQLLMADAGG